ncbi:hypothetical protein [Paraburkholderia youngii]|uniref:hypothetical protein n=1 Tax=Paraburkholderia youngii TaxID=2782701 RepID=UPI003D25EFA0
MPHVERAIFIAAPHQGTPFGSNRLSRWTANLVRLPLALLNEFKEVMGTATNIEAQGQTFQAPNSIEPSGEIDPLIRAISQLPIGPHVCFRSIMAWCRESGRLEDSDDGVVPYRSAHLAGALSEKAIIAGHSVQQMPRARGGGVGEVTAEQPGAFSRRRGPGEIDQVSETFEWSARVPPIHSLQITY